VSGMPRSSLPSRWPNPVLGLDGMCVDGAMTCFRLRQLRLPQDLQPVTLVPAEAAMMRCRHVATVIRERWRWHCWRSSPPPCSRGISPSCYSCHTAGHSCGQRMGC
jgi:hypothetical protein